MNAANIPLRALGCIVPLWLTAVIMARAELPDPIPSVRFRYEGQSRLTGSPVFPNPKTDYEWGEFAKHNSDARLFCHDLYPSDPSDSSAYTASITESFVLDASTILTCVKSTDISLDHSPRSLEDAKAMYEDCFLARQNGVPTDYYFETVTQSAHEKLLAGYSFLGMTPDGPIWRLSEPTSDSVSNKQVFEYKSSDKIEYRFVFDRHRSLFSNCSISLRGTKAPPGEPTTRGSSSGKKEQHTYREPFSYVSEISDKGDSFILTSSSTQNPSTPNAQVTRVTRRIFDFELNRTDPIAMVYTPKNGERIDKLGTPQITFEWQDGKIVKVVNPYVAEDVERVRFVKSHRWMIAVNLAIIVALLLVYWIRRKRLGDLLVIAILLSTSNVAYASDAYCGVYSLYGAAKSLGIDVDLETLIDPQYISHSAR